MVVALAILLIACASQPRPRVLPQGPPGALTLAQVTLRVPRDLVVRDADTYRILRAAGIDDDQIRDGSLVLGRVNCCKDELEGQSAIAFFVPAELAAETGDIVEVRLGANPDGAGGLGAPNRASRVVQKGVSGSCRWDPPQASLWGRVLYCDWMPNEGWLQEGPKISIFRTWIKKP